MSLLLALTGATGSNNQAISVTLDDVAVSSAQVLQHGQFSAITLDTISVGVAQVAQHSQSVAFTLGDIDVSAQQIGPDPFIQLIIGGRRQRERELARQKEIESEAVSDAVFEEIQIKPRRTLRLRPAEVPDTTSHLLNEGVARAKQIKQRREEEDLMLMF